MPSLQCPDCAQPHSLDSVGGAASFRCRGCGRALKVPERFVTAPVGGRPRPETDPATRTEGPAVGASAATSAAEVVRPEMVRQAPVGQVSADRPESSRRGRTTAAAGDSGPLWLRVILWIVAIPFGALVVFGVAEAIGALSGRQLLATFLETGVARFGAVARLLPFWALVSAAFVHFALLALARFRARRSRRGSAPDGGAPPGGRYEREPARAGS